MILAIEASVSGDGTAAVGGADGVCREVSFGDGGRDAGRLFSEVDRLFREFEGEISEIRVGLGPGSFSGIRQVLALALGLAQVCGAEVTGACSHMALDVEPDDYFAVGDARRGDVYFSEIRSRQLVDLPVLISAEMAKSLSQSGAIPAFAVGSVVPWSLPVAAPRASRLFHLNPVLRGVQVQPIYLREPNITQSSNPLLQPGRLAS